MAVTEGILLGTSHTVHIGTSRESHCTASSTFSSRFLQPCFFSCVSKSGWVLFRRHRDRSGDKYKGGILVERQSTEAARRDWIDGAEQGDMGSFPVLPTISAPYGSIT